MRPKSRPMRVLIFAVATGGVLYQGLDAHSRGGQPKTKAGDKSPPGLTKLYYGVMACSTTGCHDNPKQKDVLLCRYDEVPIWTKEDKHKDANNVLYEARAKRMADLLKASSKTWQDRLARVSGEIGKEPSCVSCHGVLVEDKEFQHSSFKPEDGVSCVACHGPYKEWVSVHQVFLERDKWRLLTRQEKESKYGMRDLWDPAKRATLCASCHIGNVKQGKFVTHEMYAAGHPPLPGLEAAFFSEAMPRHWDYLYEKKPEVQKILRWDPAKNSLEKTELVVLAGLVSFRETMSLIADQAELGEKAKGPDSPWPELAHFDCYACHHDLKSKSWRQQRGYEGILGRPNMRAWSLALLDLALRQADDENLQSQFQAKKKKLIDAYDAQPFGEPSKIRAAALDLYRWADQAIAAVRDPKRRIDHASATRLLVELGQIPHKRILDYDSARQLAWAFLIMHRDVHPSLWDNARDSKADITEAKDPEVAKGFRELDQLLKLKLPRGQVRIEDNLAESLLKIANYEPADFRRTLDSLIQRAKQAAK